MGTCGGGRVSDRGARALARGIDAWFSHYESACDWRSSHAIAVFLLGINGFFGWLSRLWVGSIGCHCFRLGASGLSTEHVVSAVQPEQTGGIGGNIPKALRLRQKSSGDIFQSCTLDQIGLGRKADRRCVEQELQPGHEETYTSTSATRAHSSRIVKLPTHRCPHRLPSIDSKTHPQRPADETVRPDASDEWLSSPRDLVVCGPITVEGPISLSH